MKRVTWPLRLCLPSEALVKLKKYQERVWGLKLEILTKEPDITVSTEIESLDEITGIMKEKPKKTGCSG